MYVCVCVRHPAEEGDSSTEIDNERVTPPPHDTVDQGGTRTGRGVSQAEGQTPTSWVFTVKTEDGSWTGMDGVRLHKKKKRPSESDEEKLDPGDRGTVVTIENRGIVGEGR